jgi:hypothetical protein
VGKDKCGDLSTAAAKAPPSVEMTAVGLGEDDRAGFQPLGILFVTSAQGDALGWYRAAPSALDKGEKQIPYGDDNKKGKGRSGSFPFGKLRVRMTSSVGGNDNKKSKSQKQKALNAMGAKFKRNVRKGRQR